MAIEKEKLKKGIFLVVILLALGLALPFMMGETGAIYFMVELPNGDQLFAQVADKPREQVVGLFFTERLRPNQGMLFIYDEEDRHKVWTKNVHFPIDIIWLDRDRTILHLEENAVPCPEEPCKAYGSDDPFTLYVLQVKEGFIQGKNLKVGESMVFRLYQAGDS